MVETANNEAAIDDLVGATPALPALRFDLLESAETFNKLCDDIAHRIYPYSEVARRYGLTDGELIRLVEIPQVAKIISDKRSLWHADANVNDRLRAYAAASLTELLPIFIGLAMDHSTPTASRIDITKEIIRVSGVVPSNNARDMAGPPPGSQFAVNITFSQAGKTEKMTIEGDARELPVDEPVDEPVA